MEDLLKLKDAQIIALQAELQKHKELLKEVLETMQEANQTMRNELKK